MSTDEYRRPQYSGKEQLLAAEASDDPLELATLIIAAVLEEDDFEFLAAMCTRLSSHSDEIVRGNAMLGFGHLARIFGRTTDAGIDIVRLGLQDRSAYARGQAHAAAGDLQYFLKVPLLPETIDDDDDDDGP